jgi:predicted Zn finger-like uncharacterized protein
MQIVCPQCAATYEVADISVGAAGRKVRCAACRTVWVATPVVELVATGLSDGAGFDPPAPERRDAPAEAPPPAESTGASEAPDRVIDHAPPLTPADSPDSSPAPETEDAPLVRRAARLRRGARKASFRGWPSAILGLLALITGILAWRADIVRVLPQTASLFAKIGMPVNLRGLAFHDVSTALESQEGVSVLVITGVIVNMTRQSIAVPRLRLALLNDVGREVHAWSALPERNLLGPREAQPVHIRLASPPAEGRRLQLRFYSRGDAASGTK